MLDGSAFAVYDQLETTQKESADAIEHALLSAFSLNKFEAYDRFRKRNWHDGEPVDVYLSELRKLAKLADIESDNLIRSAFIVGLPVDVSSQLRSHADINKSDLSALVEQARVYMEGRAVMCAVASSPVVKAEQGVSHSARMMQDHKSKIECYNCKGMGHMARECPSAVNSSRKWNKEGRAQSWQAQGGNTYASGEHRVGINYSNAGNFTCFQCGGVGHLARFCTNNDPKQGNGQGKMSAPPSSQIRKQ